MYLEITNVSEPKLSEKAQKNYRVINVRKNVISKFTNADGTIAFAKGVPQTGTIVAWENRWDNGINDLGFDEKEGTFLLGDIVRRKVVPYNFTDKTGEVRTVESYKTVVLGDVKDPSFSVEVDTAFSRAGHEIVEVQTV